MKSLLLLALLLFTSPASANLLVGTIEGDLWNDPTLSGVFTYGPGFLNISTLGSNLSLSPSFFRNGLALTIGPNELGWYGPSLADRNGFCYTSTIPFEKGCPILTLTFQEGTLLRSRPVVFEFIGDVFTGRILDEGEYAYTVEAHGALTYPDGRVIPLDGYGTDTRDAQYGRWKATLVESPEPATWLLVAGGLAMLAWQGVLSRRRAKQT